MTDVYVDRLYLNPKECSDYKKQGCMHDGSKKVVEIKTGYRGVVKKLIKYCMICGVEL